jgi:hypothetical protein
LPGQQPYPSSPQTGFKPHPPKAPPGDPVALRDAQPGSIHGSSAALDQAKALADLTQSKPGGGWGTTAAAALHAAQLPNQLQQGKLRDPEARPGLSNGNFTSPAAPTPAGDGGGDRREAAGVKASNGGRGMGVAGQHVGTEPCHHRAWQGGGGPAGFMQTDGVTPENGLSIGTQ